MIPANIARASWESAGCFLKHLARSRRGGGDVEALASETPPQTVTEENILTMLEPKQKSQDHWHAILKTKERSCSLRLAHEGNIRREQERCSN